MARSTTRFGTIANGDEIPVAVNLIGLLQQPGAPGPWEIAVEYEDDVGQKFSSSRRARCLCVVQQRAALSDAGTPWADAD